MNRVSLNTVQLRFTRCYGCSSVSAIGRSPGWCRPDCKRNPKIQLLKRKKLEKPDLEFHSALHFNRGFSGFNPTREPEEGESAIIWWSVWNTGWTTAPEHTNRLTIYDANLCSGCRKEEDEIFRGDIPAPSIVSGEQQGKSEYENAVLVGMAFRPDIMRLWLTSMFIIK